MENTMKPLCIYHSNCADGFGAAWVVRRFFGADGVDFHAGVYQNEPPEVIGRTVVLVDFSYKRDVLLKMAERSNGVLVLDHHKSAIEDLAADRNYIVDLNTYSGPVTWKRFIENCQIDQCEGAPYGRVYTAADMQRSGVGLAWDFFFPDVPRPALINHIEDRDLWLFKLDGTREIQANVFSWPYDFEVWDRLMAADTASLRAEGAAIERKHFKDIDELLRVTTRRMKIGGHVVPVANLPYTFSSDAAGKLAEGQPFAACYMDTPDGRVFSLRSRSEGLDVSEIAKQYGGGGHKNAAGFKVGYERLAEFLPTPTAAG